MKHYIKRFQDLHITDGEDAAYFINCTLVDHLRAFFDDCKGERGVPVTRRHVI